MHVRGSHFTAHLPPLGGVDWTEDLRGANGALRFEHAYWEVLFSAVQVEPRADRTIDRSLFDLASRMAAVARTNGATFVGEPVAEHGPLLCVTQVGSGSAVIPIAMFEACLTHREPLESGHVIVIYRCYEYFPAERTVREGPPSIHRAETFARSILGTLQVFPAGLA